MLSRNLILIPIAVFFFKNAAAQNNDKVYSKSPKWIEMMDDTTANYFEVVKAYDLFWKDRVKPETENDRIGDKPETKKRSGHGLFRSRKEKEELENEKYSFACKKYEHWKIIVQAYVQPDGHILTPHERIEAWRSGK